MYLDNNINVIYSVILISLLVGGLITSNRHTNSPILKYAAGWGGIFLMLIIAYSFKDRIIEEINPSKIKSEDGYIVVRQSSDNHYYMQLLVNGKKIRFLVDTGASSITLNKEAAQEIGLDLSKLKFNKQFNTANGVVYGASAIANSIQVGNIIFNDVPININGGDLDTPLLGMSFLDRFDYYKFDDDKLYLMY